MTREEAIKIIRREYSCVDRDCDIERSCGKCPYSMPSKEPILKAYCLAVEALELVTSYEGTIVKLTEALNQQTCDDCVSRQEMLDQTYLWSKDEFLRVTNPFDYLRKRIDSIPSVTPQPKTGHWIYKGEGYARPWFCSECHKDECIKSDYCPNCGARMVETQESDTEQGLSYADQDTLMSAT